MAQEEKYPNDDFEYAPNIEQQDKLINLVTTGKLAENVSPLRRRAFLENVAKGEISSTDILDSISVIKIPTPETAWDRITEYGKQQQIKGLILEALEIPYDENNYHKKREKIKEFNIIDLQDKYENPWQLQKKLKPILTEIEEENGVAKREEYEKAMHHLLEAVYGKRYEYFVQSKYLWQEAKRKRTEKPKEKEEKKKQTAEQLKEKFLEPSAEFTNITEEETSNARKTLRGQKKIPFTFRKTDGSFCVYSMDEAEVEGDREKEEQKLRKIALEIARTILTTDTTLQDNEKIKQRRLAYYRTVSPDYNDAPELAGEKFTTREFKIRSSILQIFNDEILNK